MTHKSFKLIEITPFEFHEDDAPTFVSHVDVAVDVAYPCQLELVCYDRRGRLHRSTRVRAVPVGEPGYTHTFSFVFDEPIDYDFDRIPILRHSLTSEMHGSEEARVRVYYVSPRYRPRAGAR